MDPRRKNIIFSVLPTIGVVALIVLVEVALRLFWPNPNAEPVLELTFDGREWYQVNRAYVSKYFPPGTAILPEFKPSLFFREKPADLYRVVCLGGSSMFGTPYIMSGTIPAVVRKQLRHLLPDRQVEVINWSATAINSNAVRDLSKEVLRFQPDLVLIYMGHNEYYGPDGVGATLLERWFPFLTRLKYDLRDFRLMQVLQNLLAGERPASGEANLMRQVSGAQLIPLNSDESQRIVGRFEDNLRAIVRTFEDESIPVILSEISSNLQFPPFASDSSVSSETGATIVRSGELFTRDSARAALAELAAVPARDSLAAAVQYWKGRCLLALGRKEGALRALRLARDHDLLKFRAPAAINAAIHKVAVEERLPVVLADSVLAELSGGIPGDAVFWEHLHMTNEGYAAVARLFVETALARKYVTTRGTHLLPYDVDSLSIAWLDRAYADFSIQHLTSHWPFQNYRRESAVIDQAPQTLREVARATYARELPWDEGCYRSATYFWSHRQFREARTTYAALLEEYPYGFYPNYLMGSLLNHMRRTAEAVPYYQRSVRSNPSFPRARLDLALIGINAGRAEEGIRELTAILDLLPSTGQQEVRAMVYYGLAAAHANLGDLNTALSTVDQALTIAPNYSDAIRLRAQIIAAAER